VYCAEWGSRSRIRDSREDEAPAESDGDYFLSYMK